MKRRRKKADLPSKEWDFSTCLDQDRNACLHYEYAREFLRGRPDLTDGPNIKNRAAHLLRLLSLLVDHGTQFSDYFPMLSRSFPATPWLELSKDERRTLRAYQDTGAELLAPGTWPLENLCNFAENRKQQFEHWRKDAVQWLEKGGYISGEKLSFNKIFRSCPHPPYAPEHLYRYYGHVHYALIKLDWRKSDNDLRESFEQLLGWRVPFPGEAPPAKQKSKDVRTPFPRRGGRGGPFDQLRQLSALRLKNYYGNSEDVIELLEERESDLPHKNARSVDNGATKAKAVLRKMEEEGRFSVFSNLA